MALPPKPPPAKPAAPPPGVRPAGAPGATKAHPAVGPDGKLAKKELIEQFTPFVRGIAAKIKKSLAKNIEFDDLVAYAGHAPGVSTEDMVVRRIGGRDILGVGVQSCKAGYVGGLELIDVTDPSNPVTLSFLPVPSGGVHELDMTVRPDGKALAIGSSDHTVRLWSV